MTEEEAKKKWCAHMFPYMDGQKSSGHNCYADDYETRHTDATKCMASDCMAWRWHGVKINNRYKQETEWVHSDDGYCGLAGKP